ncbi:MAG: type III pantothenate kinase [Sulfuricurvum sp.]
MTLIDIGNTNVDIFCDNKVTKISVGDFAPDTYTDDIVWYASVNRRMDELLNCYGHWMNIEQCIDRTLYYPTMGIDRIMVCEAIEHGIIVDAGSAITVDVMNSGVYQGGMISPGLYAMQRSYRSISPVLDVSFNFEVDLDKMAKNTQDAVTKGYLSPLIHYIKSFGMPIYMTGGDALMFKHFLPEAHINEMLLFEGMKKLIQKGFKC